MVRKRRGFVKIRGAYRPPDQAYLLPIMTDSLREALQASLGTAYTIERELHGGGMSRVFIAEDAGLGRRIVVKVMPPEMAGTVSLARFEREIRVAARLQHPHIVPLLSSAQTASGIPFYTMPFVRGESLRERITRSGELSVAEATRILRDVAAALAYAHGEGVVHRDIKPDNVILSGGVAVVTDFGVAKAMDVASTQEGAGIPATGITSLGVALGTPAYMSPEQASADPQVDHRADIYSFGVMAYELLTGAPPFANRPPQRMLAAHVAETPEPVSKHRPQIPIAVGSLVMRCLEKRAADRPQSADEIVRVLDELATPSGGTLPSGTAAGAALPRRVLIIAASVAVLVVIAIAAARILSRETGPHPAKSIAVLPFTTMGVASANDFFSEGMTEEITGALTKIPGLSVAPRSTAAAAAGQNIDPVRAGRLLHVDAVLRGSVQRDGERVRINVALINVADGFQIWSEKYVQELKDVFDVQDKIAKAIAAGLQVRLAGGAAATLVRAETVNPEAHTLYLQGMYLWNRRTPGTINQAIAYLERATQRDSTYARAFAGLGLAYAISPNFGDADTKSTVAKALAAARHATALDSTLGEAYAAIGWAEQQLWHNRAALAAYENAIRHDTTFATGWHWRALLLDHLGRFDDAIRSIRRARELEPTSLVIATNVGLVESHAKRIAAAESSYRKAIELDPNFSVAHRNLGVLLAYQRRFDEAIAEQKRGIELQSGWLSSSSAWLACTYAMAGKTTEARALLAEVLGHAKTERVSEAAIAEVYSALGEQEEALRWLARAVENYDPILDANSRDARLDKLRADPRGAALLARTEAMQ